MGALEPSVDTLSQPAARPYLCIERLRISRTAGAKVGLREALVAIGLSEAGHVAMVGAVMLTRSLHEGWRRLLEQIHGSVRDDLQLVISTGSSELQIETLRAFPRARWQLPPSAFYEHVLQHVPPEHTVRVRHQLRSIHAQPNIISAEHAAAAALDTLTHSGLWNAAIALAGSYQDSLVFYSLPDGAQTRLFRGDAVDRLLDRFLQDIAATDQFRGCSLVRSSMRSDPDNLAGVAAAASAPIAKTTFGNPRTVPVTVSGPSNALPATPEYASVDPNETLNSSEQCGVPRGDPESQSAQQAYRDAILRESPDLRIVADAPQRPGQDDGQESLAGPEDLQPFGSPYSEDDTPLSPVVEAPIATNSPNRSSSDSDVGIIERPEPPLPPRLMTRAVDAKSAATDGQRKLVPPAVAVSAGVVPSERRSVVAQLTAPTPVQPTLPGTVDPHDDTATVVATESRVRRSENSLSRTFRYAAAGVTAVGVNVVLVGIVLALLEPAEPGASTEVPSQFVRIVEFSPDNDSIPRQSRVNPKPPGSSNGGGRETDAEPELMALALPNARMDLPPIDLTPIPVLKPVEAPALRRQTESTPPATVQPVATPPSLTDTRDAGSADPGSGVGSGTGRSDGMPGVGTGRDQEAAQGNSAPIYREPPEYPPHALMAGIEGVVTLEFAISAAGTVRDPHVVEAVPAGVFDAAALKAISKWRYSPRVAERRARQSILFSLKR